MNAEELHAFPQPKGRGKDEDKYGMTLRDYFAAKALEGLIAHLVGLKGKDVQDYAKRSYEYADAMLKQREL